MMARRPKKSPDGRAWFPLYGRDWDADTVHLSNAEEGAYFRLIRRYYHAGPLPDDDGILSRVVRETSTVWRKLRPALSPFFVIVDGRWTHKRADAEIALRTQLVDNMKAQRSAAATARWGRERASEGDAARMRPAMRDGCETDAHEQEHSPTFGGEEDPSQAKVIQLRREGER